VTPRTITGTDTYAGLLRGAADALPAADALAFPERRLTYAELLEAATVRARQLRGLRVRRGDRVGLMLPNCPEMVELIAGAALIGAVPVPINTRYKSFEVGHICRDGALSALVVSDALSSFTDLRGVLAEALPGLTDASDPLDLSLADLPDLRAVAILGADDAPGLVGESRLSELAADQPPPAAGEEGGPDDPALIMYTSGTTANAKGCVILNRALLANAQAIAERFEIPDGDRWWDPLPMFHMGALLLMTAVFSRGGAFISMDHFEPDAAFDLIAAGGATVLYPLFPTITLSLIHHERFAGMAQDGIRVVCNVSPVDVQMQVQEAFPNATLMSAYGMTELCGSAAYSRLDDTLEQRTTTCGHLLPSFEGRIVDPEDNRPVEPGVRGELVVRGPCVFDGYFSMEGMRRDAFDDEGWFHTGDLCSIDADGLLSFHGRIKDQLKVGGENVSAVEVESFLATHPAIKLAQVIGVPDPRYMEVPAAFVELMPGQSLTEDDVVAFCTGRIARFKVPRHVRFVEEWPMSSTKIQKFRLRDRLLDELADLPNNR
jgi:acyl-CoA synthetase (AMP-forming)/AMP-acid ligase II